MGAVFSPERLKALRENFEYTPDKLCALANVSLLNYTKIEEGRLRPNCREIAALARVLKTSTDYLLAADIPEPPAIPPEDSSDDDFRLRFNRLLIETNEPLETLSELTGAKLTTVGAWKSGKSKPDGKCLLTLAKHFNCSTDYLLGVSISRGPVEAPKNR